MSFLCSLDEQELTELISQVGNNVTLQDIEELQRQRADCKNIQQSTVNQFPHEVLLPLLTNLFHAEWICDIIHSVCKR